MQHRICVCNHAFQRWVYLSVKVLWLCVCKYRSEGRDEVTPCEGTGRLTKSCEPAEGIGSKPKSKQGFKHMYVTAVHVSCVHMVLIYVVLVIISNAHDIFSLLLFSTRKINKTRQGLTKQD